MEIIELFAAILGFFLLGHAINSISESLFWKWEKWRASREDSNRNKK